MKKITEIQLSCILILVIPSILLLVAVSGSLLSGLIPLSDRLDIDLGVTGEEGDITDPLVEAAFIPTHVESMEGIFVIYFTVTDNDPEPEITAILQIFLPEGWLDWAEWENDPSEIKIEVNYDDEEIEIEGPDSEKILNDLIDLGGLVVDNGQLLQIELKDDKVEIELLEPQTGKIELTNFEGEPISMVTDLLKVTAVDDAGNIGIATATPPFDDDDEDTCSSPIEYIEEQIALLEDIENSEAEDEINDAIDYLEKAIEAFERELIGCAFRKIRYAVEDLMDAQNEDGAGTQEVIDNLIDLVQCIVDQAMNDAIELVGEENPHVIEAQEKYENALTKIGQGKYDNAIKEFKRAYAALMNVLHSCVSTLSVSTTNSATITLTLHKEGFVVCYYGVGTPTYSTEVTSLSLNHVITLTGLIPNSEYSYYLEITHDLEFPGPDDDNTHRYPDDSSYLTFTTNEELTTTPEEPITEEDFSSDWSDGEGTSGFEIIPIIAFLIAGVFLYRRRRRNSK
ncbi:MAG: hypothetical protein JSW11_01200 [Candidatus Heimdallarchaeota archaeon]|nr:MAG: hypothetical protein JSW11_01200 [Candidatus Heimdallarchaeota archaeon]